MSKPLVREPAPLVRSPPKTHHRKDLFAHVRCAQVTPVLRREAESAETRGPHPRRPPCARDPGVPQPPRRGSHQPRSVPQCASGCRPPLRKSPRWRVVWSRSRVVWSRSSTSLAPFSPKLLNALVSRLPLSPGASNRRGRGSRQPCYMYRRLRPTLHTTSRLFSTPRGNHRHPITLKQRNLSRISPTSRLGASITSSAFGNRACGGYRRAFTVAHFLCSRPRVRVQHPGLRVQFPWARSSAPIRFGVQDALDYALRAVRGR